MIALTKSLKSTYDEALVSTREALKSEGFGVLTEVDMRSTLKQKLNVDFRRYTILGACNPPLAHQALEATLAVGLMMPCNVVVYEGDDKLATVMAIDPTQTMAAADPALQSLAQTVKEKLARALEKLS